MFLHKMSQRNDNLHIFETVTDDSAFVLCLRNLAHDITEELPATPTSSH